MAVITNLVAYYSLDESSGNATDAFGSKTLTESGTVGSATGKIAGARDFERTDNVVLTRSDSAFSFPSSDYTVACWIKSEDVAGSGGFGAGIVCYLNGATQGDWWVGTMSDGGVCYAHFSTNGNNAAGLRYTGSGFVVDASWVYIVARNSAGTFTIWTDGVSRSFSTTGTSSGWGTNDFTVGRQYVSGGSYSFDGLVDELAVWNAAKSDADIAWLYNSGNGQSYGDIVAEAGGAAPIGRVIPVRPRYREMY